MGAHSVTGEELRLFAAAADRILPGVGEAPGATDAGAADFLAAGGPEVRRHEATLRRGLAFLDGLARDLHGVSFDLCSAEQRDGLLRRVESLPHPFGRRFLDALIRLTLVGTFCDPRHGGNQGGAAWRALGLTAESSVDARSAGEEAPCGTR